MMLKKIAAYAVHLLTASGALVGIFSLLAISHERWVLYFILMALAIVIDAIDGTFARWVDVKAQVPMTDGALLDNVVDFFNYALVPAYFLLVGPLLQGMNAKIAACSLVVVASSYQFTQLDAKTPDHFFKRFPSYWNIVVFYLFYWQTGYLFNACVLFLCFVLSFVPIKYIYPSRMQYLSREKIWQRLMLFSGCVWGALTCWLMVSYPVKHTLLDVLSVSYVVVYLAMSFYRTLRPLPCQPVS